MLLSQPSDTANFTHPFEAPVAFHSSFDNFPFSIPFWLGTRLVCNNNHNNYCYYYSLKCGRSIGRLYLCSKNFTRHLWMITVLPDTRNFANCFCFARNVKYRHGHARGSCKAVLVIRSTRSPRQTNSQSATNLMTRSIELKRYTFTLQTYLMQCV